MVAEPTYAPLLPTVCTLEPVSMDIALFSPYSLFADGSDGATSDEEEKTNKANQSYVERNHQFAEMELVIREFSFHQMNANLLWPGTFSFAEWLTQHSSLLKGRRIIELGSGTGALAIFLAKALHLDITTSDYDDQEIEENIAHNCRANGITPPLPHIKHSWGDAFPIIRPDWELVLASDILLYVKQYPNLIKTLCFLLKPYQPKEIRQTSVPNGEHNGNIFPVFLMSWRRRIGKEDESLFFKGCEDNGLIVEHLGSRVYSIKCPKNSY